MALRSTCKLPAKKVTAIRVAREGERPLLLSNVQYGQVNYCGQSLIGSVHVNKSFVSYSVDVFVVVFARPLPRTAIVGSERLPPYRGFDWLLTLFDGHCRVTGILGQTHTD